MVASALPPLPVPFVWLLLGALAFYVAALVVYRAFVSPLASIPGPKLAGVTSWYECYYDVVLPGQYAFKIKKMHRKYGKQGSVPYGLEAERDKLICAGPIVRIAPNEVSVSDPAFVDTIYAPGPGRKRDKDFAKNKSLGVNSSVGGSIAHDLHRKRREALNPFFSHRSISRLNPELAEKVSQVEEIFRRAKAGREVLNISDTYYAFCNE